MPKKPLYTVIGGSIPLQSENIEDTRAPNPDAVEGEADFIDWPQWYEDRGLKLREAPVNQWSPNYIKDAHETDREPEVFAAASGFPAVVYGKRTGHGRFAWPRWWQRLGEFMRRPEMWLRRLLITAWVLVPALPKAVRNPKKRMKLWPVVIVAKRDVGAPPFTHKKLYMRVVPVLKQRFVNWIPKFVMKLLVWSRVIEPFAAADAPYSYAGFVPRRFHSNQKGLIAESNTGVTADLDGVYDPMREYRKQGED